jgi:AraC-like DNA-binding protein
MRTNELAKTTLVDDGECLSFHTFSAAADTSSFNYAGFELLVLPDGLFKLVVAGERFELSGPQVLLLGPGLEHGWMDDSQSVGGLAIRWPADLLGDRFLDKRQTGAISGLLEKAAFGVRFPAAVVGGVRQRLDVLRGRSGFAIYLDLLALLHELSLADGQALLATLPAPVAPQANVEKKSPIDEVMALMQTNYFRPITLEEMARKACMTKGSFCRSFRKKTGKTYAESLNEIRLGHICRLLAETRDTVSEIAYRAGYQNIHHFHRYFKRVKGCTPLQWREGRR